MSKIPTPSIVSEPDSSTNTQTETRESSKIKGKTEKRNVNQKKAKVVAGAASHDFGDSSLQAQVHSLSKSLEDSKSFIHSNRQSSGSSKANSRIASPPPFPTEESPNFGHSPNPHDDTDKSSSSQSRKPKPRRNASVGTLPGLAKIRSESPSRARESPTSSSLKISSEIRQTPPSKGAETNSEQPRSKSSVLKSNKSTFPANSPTLETAGSSTDSSKSSPSNIAGSLLHDILRSDEHCQMLREHLELQKCEENLDFWLEVESFKNWVRYMREKDDTLDFTILMERAAQIYEDWVNPSSSGSINLPSKILARLKHIFKSTPQIEFDETVFDEAQKSIFRLIEVDPLPRFLTASGDNIFKELNTFQTSLPESDFQHIINNSTSDYYQVHGSKTRQKWHLLSEKSGIELFKAESSKTESLSTGVMNIKIVASIEADVNKVSDLIIHAKRWKEWYMSEAIIVELERLSPQLSIIFISRTKKKDSKKLRETTLATGWKTNPDGSIIFAMKTVPHTCAPESRKKGVHVSYSLSGWYIVPVSRNRCLVTHLLKLHIPAESKFSEKEPCSTADSMEKIRQACT